VARSTPGRVRRDTGQGAGPGRLQRFATLNTLPTPEESSAGTIASRAELLYHREVLVHEGSADAAGADPGEKGPNLG